MRLVRLGAWTYSHQLSAFAVLLGLGLLVSVSVSATVEEKRIVPHRGESAGS